VKGIELRKVLVSFLAFENPPAGKLLNSHLRKYNSFTSANFAFIEVNADDLLSAGKPSEDF
jgi:hypothetical protein